MDKSKLDGYSVKATKVGSGRYFDHDAYGFAESTGLAGAVDGFDALGIASINITNQINSQVLPDGNRIADLGTYTRVDGTLGGLGETSKLGDIDLAEDTFHRTFSDALDITAVINLPDMQGSGQVRDLREATKKIVLRLVMSISILLPLHLAHAEPLATNKPLGPINLDLPVHQQKKLHPEISDPVLGDQAHIVEWAWSPQYAKRFGLKPQTDGLNDGSLWLIGIKIQREQNRKWQRYTCSVVGVMDNRLAVITPPGDRFAYPRILTEMPGSLPQPEVTAYMVEQRNYAPGFQTWYKKPATKRQETHPHNSYGMSQYTVYIRNLTESLSYFEATVGCAYFGNPTILRNELRFPTKIDGKDDEDRKVGAVFEPSAIRFEIPDNLMRRIYPYTVEADDWTSCLGHRTSGAFMSLHATKTKRFGNTCEPVKPAQ